MQDIIDNLNEQKKKYEKKNVDRIPAIMLRSSDDNSMFIIQLIKNAVQCKTLEFKHKATERFFLLMRSRMELFVC